MRVLGIDASGPALAVALIEKASSVSIFESAALAPEAVVTSIDDIAARPPDPALPNCAATFRSFAPVLVKVSVPGLVPSSEKSTVNPVMPSLSMEFFSPTATISSTEVAAASCAVTV